MTDEGFTILQPDMIAFPSRRSSVTPGDLSAERPDAPQSPEIEHGSESLWIDDDGLLRDEGAVFGLSGDAKAAVTKEECIVRYYQELIARAEAERNRFSNELSLLKERRNCLARDEAELAAEAERLSGPAEEHLSLLRCFTGAALAVGLCYFNYFLVLEELGSNFSRPQFIALGVTFAGLFALYQPVSLLFSSDEHQQRRAGAAELWKTRLSEFGLPIAAALFVTTLGWGRHLPAYSAVEFIFLSLLFLFGGKLLLSTLPLLGSALRQKLASVRKWWRARKIASRMVASRAAIEGVERQMAAIQTQMRATDSPAELSARRDRKRFLFRSEFELAFTARTKTPARKISVAGLAPVEVAS